MKRIVESKPIEPNRRFASLSRLFLILFHLSASSISLYNITTLSRAEPGRVEWPNGTTQGRKDNVRLDGVKCKDMCCMSYQQN